MFAVHEVKVAAGYEVVADRLLHLVNCGHLHEVSEAAYEGGLQIVLRVGPLGGVRGLSKLVRVRTLTPVRHGATTTISVRWEATGVAGDLFPILDAELLLTEDGDHSRLQLIGSYRPPFGRAGTALDRAVMSHVATATIRAFVNDLAAAITTEVPDPAPGR
jgi:hypothetical protein